MSGDGVRMSDGGLCLTEGCPGLGEWLVTDLPVADCDGPGPGERWSVLLCERHGREVESSILRGELCGGDAAPLGCALVVEEL
jgi:hypothetical protein